MGVNIKPMTEHGVIKVSGDVGAFLETPRRSVLPFAIALSDGTLLECDRDGRLTVKVEGAALIHPRADGSIDVCWHIEWATISDMWTSRYLYADDPLPLFDQEVEEYAGAAQFA